MSDFEAITTLISLAALAGYLNYRFIKMPVAIGLMAVALIMSSVLVLLGNLGIINTAHIRAMVATLDFQKAVLHWMLPFLLFASALYIDVADLKKQGVVVAFLSTGGVVIGTFVTGGAFWYGLKLMGVDFPFVYALLFGALISPTDPIASLGIIKKIGAPKSIETKIAGESLLNDGVAVSLFLILLGLAMGSAPVSLVDVVFLMLGEILGGVAVGLLLGWAGYLLLNTVNQYEVEVLITLALAMGSYAIAERLRVSAPIAVVTAGLVVGAWARGYAGVYRPRTQLNNFWAMGDEVLNAVLFMLIGLELIVLRVHLDYWEIALIALIATLGGRGVSVAVPIKLASFRQDFSPGVIQILTWGGIRGGISIALALLVPPGPEHDIIIAATYIVVLFSILVQGMTLGKLIQHFSSGAR